MFVVQLPDGNTKNYAAPLKISEVARDISPSLAKKAIAALLDGQLKDVSTVIDKNCSLRVITPADKEGVEIIRHSTAHLLAHAVKKLYPQAQVTIGPVIENGFYYDFSYPHAFTPDDLTALEKEMARLVAANIPVMRLVWSREQAVDYFRKIGEVYKAEIIAAIPEAEAISLYQQDDFIDLCRGPHVPSTGFLSVFKLQKVAGAYWRGDAKNEMLQRIYGTAWATAAELDAYLLQIEEAERRDHRRIAKQLDLFHFQDVAPGLVFWHPNGWTIWQVIEEKMRHVYRDNGYLEVKAPQIIDRVLWEKSGHWENYRDNMFTTSSENRVYAVKPMNCPGHVQIFNADLRSYRDLPLRYGEFGMCHRNEPSGALHGLMRVRGFTQDDGHIFCSEEQIQEECIQFTALLKKVYQDFGFNKVIYKVATRPAKRVGEDALWDQAESALFKALEAADCAYEVSVGEGAFYGPKIEYTLQDAIGRQWQCGTIQVDFFMPARLQAEYVAMDGSRKTPVMLHRAILGSLERFIGILLENHAGALPLWLAPVQAVVIPITEKHHAYAQQVRDMFKSAGWRCQLDLRNEKLGYKIRDLSQQKIPYLLVVGDKEAEEQKVAVRGRENGGSDLGSFKIADFIAQHATALRQ